MLLRDFMREKLDGWEDDLDPSWRKVFSGVRLGFASMDSRFVIQEPFFLTPPRRPTRAPANAHIFRAFDRLQPEAVSLLVVGQDPYPHAGEATGRAFEYGRFEGWDRRLAPSLIALRRAALALRADDPSFFSRRLMPLASLRLEIAGRPDLSEPVMAWFDTLERQGVLSVNAAMTLTRYKHGGCAEQRAHCTLWQRFMEQLITNLLQRPNPPVFLLLGKWAQGFFQDACDRQGLGAGTRHLLVEHPHPGSHEFYGSNPLIEVNRKLSDLGLEPIHW